MRVGVIGGTSEDSFGSNVADGVRACGAEAVILGTIHHNRSGRLMREVRYVANRVPRIAARSQRHVVDAARDQRLDLIITTNGNLLPATVEKLRDLGAPVVLWYPDPVSNLAAHMMLACDYSRVYFKDPLLVDRLTAMLDVPVAYLPEACNPRLHKIASDYGTEPGLVTPGNMYPVRVRLLERLAEQKVPVRLYGTGFPAWLPKDTPVRAMHQGRSVWGEEKARVMRSATAVLNNLHLGEMSSTNCRLFDAAGSGAAILCESRPALADLFDVGTEVLAFSTFDELLDQWSWLHENPDKAEAMGDAASRRAHAEHTHAHRVRQILGDVA